MKSLFAFPAFTDFNKRSKSLLQKRRGRRRFAFPHATSIVLALSLGSAGAQAQRAPELARNLALSLGAQGRLMWVDGTANLTRTETINGVSRTVDYTTTRQGVQEIVRHCKAANINTLVIDVKPLSGQTLYNSHVAPQLSQWKGRAVPDFDVLAAFIEEGHKAGIQVAACINTLSEGHKLAKAGPIYQHPEWQSVVYTVDRGLVLSNGARVSLHVAGEPSDPAGPVLQDEDHAVSGDPSGLTGLEGPDTAGGVSESSAVGQQTNLILDENNRVAGVVDSALLGDDPLIAPEGGRIVTMMRDSDRQWLSRNVKPGAYAHFDMRTLLTPITQAPSEKVSCFVCPLHPDARRHVLDVARELATNYDIDGLVLDRCRFSNIYNDFSDLSRAAFERYIGKPVNRWPEDIFRFPSTPGGERIRGPLFKPWLEFRANVIRGLVADIARTVRSVKPRLPLGTYVGSWYPSYYEVGVNWGSDKTALRYPWETGDYPRSGYADFFDWVSTGCYYPVATRLDARNAGSSDRATVEYAADLSQQAVANSAFLYPGLYVPDYKERPEEFLKALDTAAKQGQGWMIFDLSYIDQYHWWPYLERASPKEAAVPHTSPELISSLRSAMDGVP